MTGLTLPGMIEDPAYIAGSDISPSPALGPLASSRRSLHSFDNFTEIRFSTPETETKAPVSDVASIKFRAGLILTPEMSERCLQAISEKPTGAFNPVPIAVPPRFTSVIRLVD